MKFDADILLFQVCHLLCIPKLQMEYKSHVLNKTLLNNHIC